MTDALLLDGCTLDLAGHLPVDLRGVDGGPEAVEIVVDLPGGPWRGPLEPAPWLLEGGFRAVMVLDPGGIGKLARRGRSGAVRLEHDGRAYPLVPVPGCDAVPNASAIDPVPAVPGARHRFELIIGTSLEVAVRATEPDVELASLRPEGEGLLIGLDAATGAIGRSELGVVAVWLERRGDRRAARRADLRRCGEAWSLHPSDLDHPGPEPEVWDVWAACEGPRGTWQSRVGRCRSDLRSPRSAALLPTARAPDDGGEIKLTPYLTLSAHLAVKVRAIPPPDAGGTGLPDGPGSGPG